MNSSPKNVRFSLAAFMLFITGICIFFAIARLYNPPLYLLNTGGGSMVLHSYSFGSQYESNLTDAELQRAPPWDRRTANPPLSANDAMERADRVPTRLVLQGKLQDPADDDGEWLLRGAELQPAGPVRWIWLVRFEYEKSQTGPPNELLLIVLMDGTVIEPKISPRP